MLGPQLSNGWRGHSAELSLLETELLFFRLSTFPQTTQGLREHCWPTADLLTCHSAPLCLPSSLFELIKILCFLRFRSLHAPLIFIFLTKSEWVDKCFIKLVLIPLNVSSLSSPWEYKLHQERVFSLWYPRYVEQCLVPHGQPPHVAQTSQCFLGLSLLGDTWVCLRKLGLSRVDNHREGDQALLAGPWPEI